jgi:hypothetical protein
MQMTPVYNTLELLMILSKMLLVVLGTATTVCNVSVDSHCIGCAIGSSSSISKIFGCGRHVIGAHEQIRKVD